MTKNFYVKTKQYFDTHRIVKNTVNVLNNIFTYSVFLAYFVFLVFIVVKPCEKTLYYILIPAISFVVLSVFRYFYNAKRPYEKWPELKGDSHTKKGMSFPSRHTFSAFIIAFMFLDYCKALGIVFLAVSVLIAVFRVLLIKHFVKDVLVSAVFATAIYIVFAFVL